MGDLGQGLPASRLRSTASSARRLRKRCISVYKTRAIFELEQKCIRKGIFLRASTAACRCFFNCQCCVLHSCYNAFVNMNTRKNTKTSIVNVQFSGWMTTTNHMLHCRKVLRIYILVNGNPQLTLEIYVKHPRASAPACQC